jgi:serine/threonine protein kinase
MVTPGFMAERDPQTPKLSPETTEGAKPLSASRIELLSEEFARLLSRRPHQIGDVLAARYRIVERLGQGGMGEVFVAENIALGRRVAVKLLQPELLANASFRRRFQQEADAVAAVDHPNVVRFLDLVVGDPTFLVMEYVSGPTLHAVLAQERKLDPRRAIDIARRLCWGLDAVHRAGVVHRDVKPSNIILAPDDETGEQPKLLDFGVAKQVASKPSEEQLTLAGQIVGTPHYMSPEQITGGVVDARSDVYALGCVLYHMVAGEPPFHADHQFRILSQHVQQSPAPLSRHGAEAPPELDRVLARALAKDPADRFANARELAQALAACARPSSDVPTGSISSPRKSRSWPRYAVVALAALAIGVAGASFRPRRRVTVGSSSLFLGTEPAGAHVEVDGRVLDETTPTMIRWSGAGRHNVKLHKEGYGDVERTVAIADGERTLLDITLPPRSHQIEVKTAPPGARVYLDGRGVQGATPTVMMVVDDDFHEILVERAGYETLSYSLKPEDHRSEILLTLEPERQPRGTLVVDTNGAAEVWLDDVFTGFTTPTLGLQVAAGEHKVQLFDAGGLKSPVTKVTVKAGDTQYLMLPLLKEAQ